MALFMDGISEMSGVTAGPSECINLYIGYFKSHKVERLVGRLGRGAEVLPLRLWCHCGETHFVDGRLTNYTEQDIEAICKWWKRPGEMVQAFLDLGLLEKVGEREWLVHDFTEWNGHIAALKARGRANRQKQLEKLHPASSPASSRTSSTALTDCLTNTPLSPPDRGAGGERGSRRKTKHEKRLDECRAAIEKAGT